MGYKIIEKKWNETTGDYDCKFICDSVEDIASLPACNSGSVAVVVAEGSPVHVVNASGEWKEISSANGGGSSIDMSKYFETVGGDTLTWDGNTVGLSSIMGMLYRVSDKVPSLEDLNNGGQFVECYLGENTTYTFGSGDFSDEYNDGFYITPDQYVIVVYKPNANVFGVVVAETGIYFANNGESYVSSLTINDYSFSAEYLKEEYIPPKAGEFSIKTKTFANGLDAFNWLCGNFDRIISFGMKLYSEKITFNSIPQHNNTPSGIGRFYFSDTSIGYADTDYRVEISCINAELTRDGSLELVTGITYNVNTDGISNVNLGQYSECPNETEGLSFFAYYIG